MAEVKGAYKNSKTGEWEYDFVIRGHRFRGKTGSKSEREAKAFVKEERAKAERHIADMGGRGPMSYEAAQTRWWNEVARYRDDADGIEGYLAWLQPHVGKKTLLSHIDDEKIAGIIAIRRAEDVSNRAVNASIIEILRPIMNRAKGSWKADVAEVDWKSHWLDEGDLIEREASLDEEKRLLEAFRPDYHDMFLFDFLSGLRLKELVEMTWPRIDLEGRRFGLLGKGGKVAWLPLTEPMAVILERQPRLPGQDAVWTYIPQRKSRERNVVIERQPITYSGTKSEWRRARERAGMVSRKKDPVAGFRLHDIRHTALTRIARGKGGLLAAQKLGRHKDIQTTRRYAFATDDDLRDAMDDAQTPRESPRIKGERQAKAMKKKEK